MKIAHLAACAAAALALGAHAQTPGKTASASFVDGEGNGIGSAKLTQTPGGVLIANQFVSQDGRLRAHVHNTAVRLDAKSLLDKDGSALVVQSKPDDYRSQPSGDAGDRIACAVIKSE